MKKLLGSLLLAPIAISACGTTSQEKLIIYTNRKIDNVQWIVDEYKKSNPNALEVEIVDGEGVNLMNQYIQESKANVRTADILLMQDALIMDKNKDLFQELDSSITGKVTKDVVDTSNKWIGVSARARIVAYNDTDLKKANEQLYGKLSTNTATMMDILSHGGMAMTRDANNSYFRSEITAHYAKAKKDKNLEEFKTKFEKFYGTVKSGNGFSSAGDRGVLDAVKTNGNGVSIGLANSYYFYGAPACSDTVKDRCGYLEDENIKLSFIDSKGDGTWTDLAAFGISNKSAQTTAAKDLLSVFLNAKVQAKIPTREGSGEFPTLLETPELPSYLMPLNSFNKLGSTVGFDTIVNERDEAFAWLDKMTI